MRWSSCSISSQKYLLADLLFAPQFRMVAIARVLIVALLAVVSSASMQTRQQKARVISSCTVPNTVALTFVSLFFFVTYLTVYRSRMMAHGYTCNEIYCFFMPTLFSWTFNPVKTLSILSMLQARRELFFSVRLEPPTYRPMMADSSVDGNNCDTHPPILVTSI